MYTGRTRGVTDEVDFTTLLCCIVCPYKSTAEEQHNYANTPREDYTHIFLVILRNERPPVAVSIAIYDMHRRIRRITYLA